MIPNSKNINYINEDLKRTKKAIVALGCSFTAGKAAWDDDLVSKIPPIKKDQSVSYNHYDLKTKKYIAKRFNGVEISNIGILDTTTMEENNSYVNILCKNLLKNEYTPINFGIEGCGNTATISRLLMYPIDWQSLNELIVIYMPTGAARLDFIDDTKDNFDTVSFDFLTAWPLDASVRREREKNPIFFKNHGSNKKYWNMFQDSYFECLYSLRFETIKSIIEYQNLNNWCSVNNAKLLIFPAFDRDINKESFIKKINLNVIRKNNTENFHEFEKTEFYNTTNNLHLVNSVPWDNFVKIQGTNCFQDLCLKQENIPVNISNFEIVNMNGTPNGWIAGCGHPTAKGHKLLANELVNFIK